MGKRIEDLKETAPCGMLIHYTVNEEDMITYNDINGRGVHCDKCDGCTWKGICKPEEPKKAMSHKTYLRMQILLTRFTLFKQKWESLERQQKKQVRRSKVRSIRQRRRGRIS